MNKHIVGGGPPTKSRREERLAICRACPLLRRNFGVIPDQCSVCQCFVVLKTGVPSETCPRGKW